MRKTTCCCASVVTVLALLGAAAALAAPPAPIHKGVDLWMTVAGFARTNFAADPIPAGFFCTASRPFTGTITFKGVPLATDPPNSLGKMDTVVRRLDDAVFNDQGEAATRIQLMALSLASTEAIETSCGKYDVAVSLAPGEQPITTMRLFRAQPLGGTYSAPLALNVKLVFTPASGDANGRRELTRRIDLGPGSHSVWAYVTKPRYAPGVKVDTKGDGRPDTLLPTPSNFRAGIEPAVLKHSEDFQARVMPAMACYISLSCPEGQCPYQSCHCDLNATDPYTSSSGCDHLHCIMTCVTQSCCTSTQ